MTSPEILLELQKQVGELTQRQSNIEKMLSRYNIDRQMLVTRNDTRLKPGLASKVSYDANGLITGTTNLLVSDLPDIPVSKVEGLSTILSDKVAVGDYNKLKSQLADQIVSKNITDTGCKVNIDKNGHVVSVAPLIPEDIPTIPIEKIEGLRATLDQLRSSGGSPATMTTSLGISGKSCKVTYDATGRVIGGESLTIDDLPFELTHKIATIEQQLSEMASRESVKLVNQILSNKLDTNSPIRPGTYTKITVDTHGLVTNATALTVNDIPTINIPDIPNLDDTLKSKANQNDLIELTESLDSLVNMIKSLGDFRELKSKLDRVATSDDIVALRSIIDETRITLSNFQSSINIEKVESDIVDLKSRLSVTIERFENLEYQLHIKGILE